MSRKLVTKTAAVYDIDRNHWAKIGFDNPRRIELQVVEASNEENKR